MKWQKQGLIFSPLERHEWMVSHSTAPFVHERADGNLRVFFSCRDGSNRAHLAYIDVDGADPTRVLAVADRPVLSPAPLGYFDDHGVYGRCLVRHQGRLWLHYLGWNPGLRPPMFYSAMGLAYSDDDGDTFQRHSPAPVMERSAVDPWCVLLPAVRLEDGVWRMWYASGLGWVERPDGKLQSLYNIKYADSDDGVHWRPTGRVCIELGTGETNAAHPCVVLDNGLYRMWFSVERGEGYRMGYAESPDGLTWRRIDGDYVLYTSEADFDSHMVCQPYVLRHRGRWLMFYNGNQFGRDGIGLAISSDA